MQRRKGDIRTHFAVSQTPRVQGKTGFLPVMENLENLENGLPSWKTWKAHVIT